MQFELDHRSPGFTAVLGLMDLIGRLCVLRDGSWHGYGSMLLDTKARDFAPHVLRFLRHEDAVLIVERNAMGVLNEKTLRFNRMTALDQCRVAITPDGLLLQAEASGRLRALPLALLLQSSQDRLR